MTTEQTPASMSWTKDKSGAYRCAAHGETFRLPKTCSKCSSGGEAPDVVAAPVALPKPPAGCLSSVQRERWFSKLAADALKDAERLNDATPPADDDWDFDFHVEANRVKYLDVAIKAGRAAVQLTLAREDEQIVAARERRLRKGRSH